jgi:hypothetical protein
MCGYRPGPLFVRRLLQWGPLAGPPGSQILHKPHRNAYPSTGPMNALRKSWRSWGRKYRACRVRRNPPLPATRDADSRPLAPPRHRHRPKPPTRRDAGTSRCPVYPAGLRSGEQRSQGGARTSSSSSIQCFTGTRLAPARCSWQPMLAVAMTSGMPWCNAPSLLSSSRFDRAGWRIE